MHGGDQRWTSDHHRVNKLANTTEEKKPQLVRQANGFALRLLNETQTDQLRESDILVSF